MKQNEKSLSEIFMHSTIMKYVYSAILVIVGVLFIIVSKYIYGSNLFEAYYYYIVFAILFMILGVALAGYNTYSLIKFNKNNKTATN